MTSPSLLIGQFHAWASLTPEWKHILAAPALYALETIQHLEKTSSLEKAMAQRFGFSTRMRGEDTFQPDTTTYPYQAFSIDVTYHHSIQVTLTYQNRFLFTASFSEKGYEESGPEDTEARMLCAQIAALPLETTPHPDHKNRVHALETYIKAGLL